GVEVALVEGEEVGVANDRVLDAFGQAGDVVACTERFQRVDVDEHELGLVERPDHVLAAGVVDGRLAAHAGVHVGFDGGRTLSERHAAHPGGGGKAGQVADDTAADGDQRRRP